MLTILLFLPFVSAHLALFHRLYHPTASNAPFTPRGTLHINQNNNSVSFQLSKSFADDVASFTQALHTVQDRDLLLYQVALERESDISDTQWDISSVKVCHLHLATSESIHLHTFDLHAPNPHAIDYFVSPIPHNGACPKSRSKKANTHPQEISPFLFFTKDINTTITLKPSSFPPLPLLTTPPPLSPEGEPITTVPEKSFLQKYWMYILALILFTLITGGGEEEQPRKRD